MRSTHRHERRAISGRRQSALGIPLPHLGDRGQVIVEFVLVLPILLVLVIGIIEFASAWRVSQTITNVAREGTRWAVVADGPRPGEEKMVEDSVRTLLNGHGLDGSSATVTVNLCANCAGCSTCTGFADEITIEYPYEFIFFGPAISLMAGDASRYGTITLATTTSMRNE